MLPTRLTTLLGTDHPIIQAGMAFECGAELASAVSNAGALGTIGSIGRPPEDLQEQIARCRQATDRPFSVNLVTFDWSPFAASLVDIAIAERVPVVTLSFGDPRAALAKVKAAGLIAIVQVQDLDGLKAALAAGADAVIAQGNEAGGHTGRRGTLNFGAQALDLARDTPVVLAGGIADGRGLAAALAMGAAGVVMGTRFKASHEYGPGAHMDAQKRAIAASDGSDTLYDEILDEAYGMPWPNGVTGRAIRNRFTREWQGRVEHLRKAVAEAGPPLAFVQQLAQDPETVINWAGEASGLIHEVLPAADIVARTVSRAESLLLRAAGAVEASSTAAR